MQEFEHICKAPTHVDTHTYNEQALMVITVGLRSLL